MGLWIFERRNGGIGGPSSILLFSRDCSCHATGVIEYNQINFKTPDEDHCFPLHNGDAEGEALGLNISEPSTTQIGTKQSTANGEDNLLSVQDVAEFAMRRRRVILATVVVLFLVAVAYCAFGTKRYSGEAVVEVKQHDDSLGLNSLVSGNAQVSELANPLEEDVTLATKVEEFQSDEIDLDVINQLSLQDTPDFKPSFNPFGLVLGLLSGPAPKDIPGTPFLQSPARRGRALLAFRAHLKVKVIPSTRLISVTYLSPDPVLAASVANALIARLGQYSYQTKQQSVSQLSTRLSGQLQSVQQQADALQNQEMQLRRDIQSYTMGGANASGQPSVYSPILDSLQQSTSALSQAESNRILRGAVEEVVKSGDPKLISGLAGSGLLGSGNPQSTTSLELIISLQTQEAAQEAQISQDQLRLGPAYPKLIQEKAQLEAIRQSLQAETARLAQRAANDYAIAKDQEDRTRAEHARLLQRASDINDKYLQYDVVRQQAQDARQLYTDLNRRLLGAGITETAQAGDINVVSTALVQAKPASPKVILVLPASLVLGFMLGSVLAFVVELRDHSVQSVQTVSRHLGLPVLISTPDFTGSNRGGDPNEGSVGPDVLRDPDAPYAETIRALRTAILLSEPSAKAPSAILVTSAGRGDGATTTSLNLAATFARAGSRTLLVELDLRQSVLANRLGLPPSQDGLSRILSGEIRPDWAITVPKLPLLFCVPGGAAVANSYDLISSEFMKQTLASWKSQYDVIVLDGPPLLTVNDSLLLADQVELLLVVARYGKTSDQDLQTTRGLLSRLVHTKMGAVLNAVSERTKASYADYLR